MKKTKLLTVLAVTTATTALAVPLASAYGHQTLLRGAQPAPVHHFSAPSYLSSAHGAKFHQGQLRGPVAYRAPAYGRVAQAPAYPVPVHRVPARPAPVRLAPVRRAPVQGVPVHTFAPGTVYGANAGHRAPVYGAPRAERRRPAHNNLVKLGAARFSFQDSSGDLQGAPGDVLGSILTPPNVRVDVQDRTAFAGSYTRHIGDHFGIEIPIGLPIEFDINAAGEGADLLERVNTVKSVPVTLIGNYYFTPREATVRPYVGLAVNRTFNTDETPDAGLSDVLLGPSTIETENSTGFGAFAGVNVRLSDRLHASLLGGYVESSGNTTVTTTTLPDLFGDSLVVRREIEVDLNPIVGLATVGVSF